MNERGPITSPRRRVACAMIAILLGAHGALAQDAKSPPAAPAAPVVNKTVNFDAFRLIGERNIFNPNRVGRSRGSDAPQPRVDTIALVGTMQYEKGVFAFFDGSGANYRKTLQTGGTIAQYTVTSISPDGVELVRDKKPLALKIADQLRRPEGGDWTLVGGGAVRSEAQAAEVEGAPAIPAPLAIPADASDVLKRLMEQRLKQMKQ